MTFRVRFTKDAEADLDRLYAFLLEPEVADWKVAERALDAIRHGIALLESSPVQG